MATKTIIAETEHVSAISQDIGGDTVVVTFNEMGFVRNGTRFWGDEFLLKLGVSAIGFVTPRPNWYPPRDMDLLIPAVLAQIRGRRVITYGHSQGGFGALKFSARLQAYAALSFCPQWSINPKDVGSFDTRTVNYFDPALSNGGRLVAKDVCKRSFVFYDRQEPSDARHVSILEQYEGVYPILVAFAMHDTIRILTEGRSATSLINLCRNEAPPTARDLRQLVRKSRGYSKTYNDYMIRSLILRTCHSAAHPSTFLSRALTKCGVRSTHFYSALVAYASGNDSLARAELATTTERDLEGFDLLYLWCLANDMQFLGAELTLAMLMRKAQPGNTWACLHAVKTLVRVGRLEEAQAELLRISRNPDAGNYAGYLTEFAQLIHNAAASSAASAA